MANEPVTPTISTPAPVVPSTPQAPDVTASGHNATPAANPSSSGEQPTSPAAAGENGVPAADANKPPYDPQQKIKLKVNGREEEVTLDNLVRIAQKARAADHQLLQIKRQKAAEENFIQRVRQNPREALADPRIGLDLKKFAVDIIGAEIEREQMTPEQRELTDTKRQLEEAKKSQEELNAQAREQKIQTLQNQYSQQFTQQIVQAIEENKLPKTPFAVQRFAHYMGLALNRGHMLMPKEVVHLVQRDITRAGQDILNVLDGPSLLKYLGDDNVKKLKAEIVKQVQAEAANVPKQPTINPTPSMSSNKAQPKGLTQKEFDAEALARAKAWDRVNGFGGK